MSKEYLDWMLRHRNIDEPCDTCGGAGCRWYGSTSTWRGGMGCSMMTMDVCDRCWGSGDKYNLWTDLRALKNGEDAKVKARAATLFADRCGMGLRSLRPGIKALAEEMDKYERERKTRPSGFKTVASCLAKLLRELLPPEES